MKVEQTTRVEYDEVDTDFRMKLPVLFQRLQRAALHHSESVGLGSRRMLADGAVWILNRMRVEILRMPKYGQAVTVRTWHKGAVGFRAGRDFLVFCGQEKMVAATSQWLLYDLNRKRIAKIPETVIDPYTAEQEEVFDAGAIDFAVDKTFDPDVTMTITTREGDFDPNGHVNNTVYLDYLDTLIKRAGGPSRRLTQVGIQYLKEIGRSVQAIDAGAVKTDTTMGFRFFDSSTVYAAGFVAVNGH